MIYAVRMVDVHAKARRRQELHREDVDLRQVLLDLLCNRPVQLAFLLECRRHLSAPVIENGPAGPFLRTGEMWSDECSNGALGGRRTRAQGSGGLDFGACLGMTASLRTIPA